MAIPCETCGRPVHEQAVRCPHCGELSGVPVDPIAAAEVSVVANPSPASPFAPPTYTAPPMVVSSDLGDGGSSLELAVASAVVHVVSRAIDAAIDLVKRDDPDDDPLPRATARPRSKDAPKA